MAGGQTWVRSVRHALPIVLVVVAAVCAAYASLLGHWFYSDDFVLLQNNHDLGWRGFLRFLVFADYGDRAWVYWRPGWMLLFQSVFAVAGTTPWPYYLVCLLLHAAAAGVVAVIGLRATHSRLLGLAAGLLFALMPSHVEAVAWIAASFNVIPAALCLAGAGWSSWRFATTGGWRPGVAVVLLVAISLTFKEAAYGFPLVFAAACLCAPRDGRTRCWRGRLLVFASLALLVGWHYMARSKRSAPAVDAYGIWSELAHYAAGFLRGMVPLLPANDLAAVGVAVVLAVPLLLLASPLARFLLLWTGAAFLPYVALSYGERFAYFVHVPAVLFVTRFSADLAQRWRWRHGASVAGVLWSGVALLAALQLPAALEMHRRKGDECRRIQEFVAANGLAARPELLVDAVPMSLENGFEAMVELFGGGRPKVVHLQVVQRPPFLLYLNREFGALPDTTPVLQLATGDAPRLVDKAALVGDLLPLPILSLVGDYELVADEAAAQAALRAPGHDLRTRPLLFERPACAIEPPGDYWIERPVPERSETAFDVECARPSLLLIAFPVAVDLHRRGRILVDGEPVAVQRANLLFHAICMPPGRHRVSLRPVFGGD
jgi:hypothetical protein